MTNLPINKTMRATHRMERRTFLKTIGVAAVVVTGGRVFRAIGAEIPDGFDGPAFEPWDSWNNTDGGLTVLVRAAILAANAVNSQPWLFKITESWIDVYADNRRNCGAFDPYLRELNISLGCAIENLVLAAGALGYDANVTLVQGHLGRADTKLQPTKVAHIEISPGSFERSELYDAIPRRHTNRAPFDIQRQIPTAFVTALGKLRSGSNVKMFLFTADEERKQIVEMIARASGELVADPQVLRDEMLWIRTDPKSIHQSRDGVVFETPDNSAKDAGRNVKEAYPDLLKTARLFGLIAVRDRYTREQNIDAGRLWQRSHLLATANGVAGRPANQAVELIDQERVHERAAKTAGVLAEFTQDSSWQPTFMFYMGYPTREAHRSARRSVEDVIT